MLSLESILAKLEDGKSVRIALPMKKGMDKFRVNCVYKRLDPPKFALLFKKGTLPENIDQHRKCAVLIDMAGQSVSISSDISNIPDDQTLEMIAREMISHEQMREYFRVDVTAPLKVASLDAALKGSSDNSWELTGETIDVSGSGLLAVFPEPINKDATFHVKLVLPTGTAPVVEALAHVVRLNKVGDNHYQVALHFDQIDGESRDKIMAACFEVQRQHLRLKVQVKNIS